MAREAAVPPAGEANPNEFQRPRPTTGNLVVKCPKCKEILLAREWEKNQKVCLRCNYHFKLTAQERIKLLVDPESFVEIDANMVSADPLKFVKSTKDEVQTYPDKLQEEMKKSGLNEAVISGHALIESMPLALAIMDFRFLGASMGSVVGEKITRTIELGLARKIPVLVASASGGARMHEGTFALMQMAKTAAALAKLGDAGIPYFSLLTDPTTGGVTASFAMLGDVTLAEPGALIGFAGPRVIEQFMHIKLPEGTVNSEFVLQHGMIDAIIHRSKLRTTLARLLRMYAAEARPWTRGSRALQVAKQIEGNDGLRPGI
ncbi:MAG TPA: acetyl-CoA carboxylase, carboxyltransferase subunit beta [Ktedonobacteraceae bacterium]|nr:acetyl-CoA carboxylase, carboxyltransferase subunit beta [Ktedonobacteraceae bacterium]